VNIETASPEKLIVMLFNGAIKRAEDAQRAITSENPTDAHPHLIRAQEIIAELRASLNPDMGEISQQLDRSYEYLYHLLVMANVRKEMEPLMECLGYLRDLRDTWEDAIAAAVNGATAFEPETVKDENSVSMNVTG